MATVSAWLATHPGIEIVARDRGGGYAQAAAQGAPKAIQVADRWHLLENASAAFVDAVRRHMRPIREAVGAVTLDPTVLTAAEKRQFEGWERRKQTSDAVLALKADGVALKEIVRRTGLARQTVRSILGGTGTDVFRIRESSLDAFTATLDAEWAAGCRKGAELWRRLRAKGYVGGLRVVSEWVTRRRRDSADASGKLKLVKRQMYGRANLDLLRARLIASPA